MWVEVEPVEPKRIAGRNPNLKEIVMDAKYNWLIDNVAIRLTMNTLALALFIAATIGLLEAAVKL